MKLSAAIVALIATAVSLWSGLHHLIGRAVTSGRKSTGLERLRIGHAMAGGFTDPEAANRNIAEAIKSLIVAKIIGPKAEAQLRGMPVDARTAYQRLISTLRSAEARYLSPVMSFGVGPAEHASSEIAEGLRYVAHVTRLALELYTEASPSFVRFVTPRLKMLGDNPDALYFISAVSAGHEYVVRGCKSGEVYLSFSVHQQPEGTAFPRVISDINDANMTFDRKGCYHLVLTAGDSAPDGLPAGASWLRLPAGAESLISRHYFELSPVAQLNRPVVSAVADSLSIEERSTRLAHASPASQVLTDAEMASRLTRAETFVRSMTVGNEVPDPTTAPPFFSLVPNTVGKPQKWSKQSEGMGAVDIAYAGGRFLLKSDEALILRGTMPACRFANIVLWNRFLQSFEYDPRGTERVAAPVSLSRSRLHLSSAGNFTIVLSARSPFANAAQEKELRANWLSSEGRASATMFFRFVLPEEDVPQPAAKALPLADVLSELTIA